MAMSDSSQFLATSADAAGGPKVRMNACAGNTGNSTYGRERPIRATKSVSEQASSTCRGVSSPVWWGRWRRWWCLFRHETIHLFATLSWSCENPFFHALLKTWTSKKGCRSLSPGPWCEYRPGRAGGTGQQRSERAQGQLWQIRWKRWFALVSASSPASLDLCGRLSVGSTKVPMQGHWRCCEARSGDVLIIGGRL